MCSCMTVLPKFKPEQSWHRRSSLMTTAKHIGGFVIRLHQIVGSWRGGHLGLLFAVGSWPFGDVWGYQDHNLSQKMQQGQALCKKHEKVRKKESCLSLHSELAYRRFFTSWIIWILEESGLLLQPLVGTRYRELQSRRILFVACRMGTITGYYNGWYAWLIPYIHSNHCDCSCNR